MGQNTVIYFAVDKDGTENIFDSEPRRFGDHWGNTNFDNAIELPTGTIKKLTGENLTWEDYFREYIGDNYDPSPATQWYDEE